MKARIKETSCIIEVSPIINLNAKSSNDNLYSYNGRVFKEQDLDFLNIEDCQYIREQKRYEIAKAAMNGILSNKDSIDYACSESRYMINERRSVPKSIAKYALACADALMEELKI